MYNSRNSYIRTDENIHVLHESCPQYRFTVNVWNVWTDNWYTFDTCCVFKFLTTLLGNIVARNMYFMHHHIYQLLFVNIFMHLLEMVDRTPEVSWMARTPDLNPVDFLIWVRLKEMVYRVNINTQEKNYKPYCNIIRNDPVTLRRSFRHLIVRQRCCTETVEFHFENF